MKRFDCLKLLAPMVDQHMLTVTSLSSNTAFWSDLRPEGANFFGCNMGLCIPFALGLTAAFPKRKVIAFDSDGSLMNDTSSLITVADVNPPNFVAIVMDNGSYARMGSTFTSRKTDLEKIAQGAGIANTSTVRTKKLWLPRSSTRSNPAVRISLSLKWSPTEYESKAIRTAPMAGS